MASKEIKIKYVHELPFGPRKDLCRMLDADRRWEELGGYMEYDITTLTLIGQAVYRDKSPTWDLLNKFSEINGTINKLFLFLNTMKHQRAMTVLKPYVDPKYHRLLKGGGGTTTSSQLSYCMNEDFSQSSFRQYTTSTQSSHQGNSHKHASTSKYASNNMNLNKEQSSVSHHSKLNSLNGPNASKATFAKKSGDASSAVKKNTVQEEASIFDNCLPEKMKDCKKQSKVKVSENGKPKFSSHFACAVSIPPQDDCLPDIMRIPYEDICKATDGFNKDRILGRGGFGTVYKGEWKGASVAIKRLTPRHSTDDPSQQLVSMKQSLNELNVLKCCRFDHILPLYAVSLDGEFPCLIYQLMVNGSLEDRLLCKNNTTPLTWSQRSHIAECTTKGLNYLHTTPEKPLVHGDIKSANILLDANMDAKIGDFGLTREGPGCDDTHVKVSSVHGTECYLPPEYLRMKHLSPQVDIYCYGIVLLEIATGLRPFDMKRGPLKRLTNYVRVNEEAGRLETIRDVKAGEENMMWFQELIRIGLVCSSYEKKRRPPMSQVLGQFEKIKQDMSIVDKIRRLSSDKGSSPLPSNLTPLEIQMFYDMQKSGVSPNRLSLSPGKETQTLPPTSKFEEPKSVQQEIPAAGPSNISGKASDSSSEGAAPIPLLTVLRLQVPEVEEEVSENISSHSDQSSSITDSHDYVSED